MLVTLHNNWNRWTDLANSPNNKSNIRSLFTRSGTADNGDDASSTIPGKFSGWNNMGMQEFNEYVVTMKKNKRHRVPLMKNYLEVWQQMAAQNARPNRRRPRRREQEQVHAENNLFGDNNGGAVEDTANPFAGFERIESV